MSKSEEHLNRISATMALYAEMRFKQLTVFLAWLTLAGGGLILYGEKEIIESLLLRQVLTPATMLVTAIIWVMEIRSSLYWVALREGSPELWPRPKDTFPPFKIFNATNMVVLLYICNYVFWCWLAFQFGIVWWITTLFVVGGICLLLFNFFKYLPLWRH